MDHDTSWPELVNCTTTYCNPPCEYAPHKCLAKIVAQIYFSQLTDFRTAQKYILFGLTDIETNIVGVIAVKSGDVGGGGGRPQ